MPGQRGSTVCLEAPGIGGTFEWARKDPLGRGDDGGLVIRAPRGWWVRRFHQGLDAPIELDWFQPSEGTDITPWVRALAEEHGPDLFLRVPSTPMTLRMQPTDLGGLGIRRFALLESGAPVTIRQASEGVMLRLEGLSCLVIGSPAPKAGKEPCHLTLEGLWTWEDRVMGERECLLEATGMGARRAVERMDLRFNTRNPRGQGFRVSGQGRDTDVYRLAGHHENSGFYVGMMHGTTEYEDLRVSDPLGAGMGWKGGRDGATARTREERPLGNIRGRGASAIYGTRIRGRITLEYGGAHWGSMFARSYGNGIADPLVVTFRNLGYSGPNTYGRPEGVRMRPAWFLWNAGKFDGQTGTAANDRHLKFIFENTLGPYAPAHGFFLEASQLDDNAAGGGTQTCHNLFTLVNGAGSMGGTAAGKHPEDDICRNVWQGTPDQPAMVDGRLVISHHDTVRDGRFHDVSLERLQNGRGGLGNTLSNLVLTGRVMVHPGVRDTVIRRVTWAGARREVLRIGVGASVDASGLAAPIGSVIAGEGALVLDGQPTPLPHVFREDTPRTTP